MKHKTAELTGALLDAAVAMAKGLQGLELYEGRSWCLVTREGKTTVPILVDAYSTDWACGGPIIEREQINVVFVNNNYHDYKLKKLIEVPASWGAIVGDASNHDGYVCRELQGEGPTPLIAAMRAFVASKLGDEVDLP